MKEKAIISTQVYEWYGNEDAPVGDENHGRYKPKWGHDIVVEMDEYLLMEIMFNRKEEFAEKFNKDHNQIGSYIRHKFIDIEPYYEPSKGVVENDMSVKL